MSNARKVRSRYYRDLGIEGNRCICEYCAVIDNRIEWAESVHHILPISKGGSDKVNNLMALCQSHHIGWHKGIYGDVSDMRDVRSKFHESVTKYYDRMDELSDREFEVSDWVKKKTKRDKTKKEQQRRKGLAISVMKSYNKAPFNKGVYCTRGNSLPDCPVCNCKRIPND